MTRRLSRAAGTALAAALALSCCGGPPGPGSPSAPGGGTAPSASASPRADATATVGATASVVASAGAPSSYGPLAVVAPSDGSDTARIDGTIDLSGDCAVLRSPGRRSLLVWPADLVGWNAAAGAVSFRNRDGAVEIANGMRVVVGGSGEPIAETGLSIAEWLNTMSWVAPPSARCEFDAYWGVGSIEPAG